MSNNAKLIYAQSSDIKSRSYLQYRKDMKKKAIAELEFIPYLQELLSARAGTGQVVVEKNGGDSELWFNRTGGITQAPDYRVIHSDRTEYLYEFQYAENISNLDYIDFKVSKVGKKVKNEGRVPHGDRQFFYVVKSEYKYCIISPQWIMSNGRENPVPAWGSRPAYRVKREIFMQQCRKGGKSIEKVIDIVQCKNTLLDFQHDFLELENGQFSRQLQNVIDENRIVKIVPRTLEGFYRTCALLDNMQKAPDNSGIWLVYLCSFFSDNMSAEQFARFMYALDFLYFKCAELSINEIRELKQILHRASAYVRNCLYDDNGWVARDPAVSAVEQTRQILFAINLLEDMQQDAAVKLSIGAKAEKIFTAVPDPIKTACAVKNWAEREANAASDS